MVYNKQLISRLHSDLRIVLEDCHRQVFAKHYIPNNGIPVYSEGCVFPFITDDPRLTLPLQKLTPSLSKTVSEYKSEESEKIWNEVDDDDLLPCDSPLWITLVRQEVFQSRVPDHVVSTRRREEKYEMDNKQKEEWQTSLSTAIPGILIRKCLNESDLDLVQSELEREQVKGKKAQSSSEQFACGWDMILPKGWATAFWIPLVYHRSRAGGLRESRNMHLESLKPHFPEDFPDCEAGAMSWDAEAENLSAKYYRKPPAKRINYCVLGVQHPFQPQWHGLFDNDIIRIDLKAEEMPKQSLKRSLSSDDNPCGVVSKKQKTAEETDDFEENEQFDKVHIENNDDNNLAECPSNDVETLESQNVIKREIMLKDSSSLIPVLRDNKKLLLLKNWICRSLSQKEHGIETSLPPEIASWTKKCLVCVSVVVLSKGKPSPCSMICMPTDLDLITFCRDILDPYKYGLQSVAGPVETKHRDPFQKERREARKERIKKRKKKKKKEEKSLILSDDKPNSVPVGLVHTSLRTQQPLTFTVTPDRKVVGYVTSGDFLFTRGCGAGIGFIALGNIIELMQLLGRSKDLKSVCSNENYSKTLLDENGSLPLLALMKNTDSTQYRFVKLNIINPS